MHTAQIYLFMIVVVVIACVILYALLSKQIQSGPRPSPYKTPVSSPLDNQQITHRFSRLRDQWFSLSVNARFKELANALMDINSEALYFNVGNKDILRAFTELDNFVKKELKVDPDLRITLIYTDGIVFYDSALPLERVYFLQNGLPKPVSMSTLGSPLKNHNVVPEMTNAVTVHSSEQPFYFLGYELKDPLYQTMIKEGFGFFERISSSLNIPYSYVAKFLPIPSANGFNTFYLDGLILRVGIPLNDNFFD